MGLDLEFYNYRKPIKMLGGAGHCVMHSIRIFVIECDNYINKK